MTLSLDLLLLDFYERFYRPQKHAGDADSPTCETYRAHISMFNQFFRRECRRLEQPERDVSMRDFVTGGDELVVGCMNWDIAPTAKGGNGNSRSLANGRRRHINAIWNWAAKKKFKGEMPLPDNEKFREEHKDPIALLPDEFERVLLEVSRLRGCVGQVPAADWWDFYVRLSFNVGGRVTAMRNIPSENFDLLRGEVLIPAGFQKNKRDYRERLFPLTLAAARKVKFKERKLARALDDFDGVTNTIRRHWAKILVAAGLFDSIDKVPRELKLHVIRKTFASQIAAKHGEHVACQKCRHSSVTVTRKYLDPRYLGESSVPELIDDPLPTTATSGRPALTVYREETA